MICRCCNSSNITIAKNRGVLAPFFVKRVYGLHVSTFLEKINYSFLNNKSLIKKLIYFMFVILTRLIFLKKFFNFRNNINVDIMICNKCFFVSPKKEYSFKELSSLYHDYRTKSYNKERVFYEPWYNKIKNFVGKSSLEIENRQKNLDYIFVKKNINYNEIKTVIDWGGNEGNFIPSVLKNKKLYVFDPSTSVLVNKSYNKINKRELLPNVDCILLAHVLEHVGNPKKFLLDVLKNLNQGGIIYLEVPQDKSLQEVSEIVNDPEKSIFEIHEHINIFTEKSLKFLCIDLGLELIYTSTNEMNLGWVDNFKIISILLRKK